MCKRWACLWRGRLQRDGDPDGKYVHELFRALGLMCGRWEIKFGCLFVSEPG